MRYDSPKLIVKWKCKWKWVSEWSIFGSFIFLELLYVIGGCLNLNFYIGKKVQTNFLMGLKIWWSWGSRFFFFKIPIGRTFLKFSFKTSVFGFSFKKNPTCFRLRDFWIFNMFWVNCSFGHKKIQTDLVGQKNWPFGQEIPQDQFVMMNFNPNFSACWKLTFWVRK